MSNRNKIIALVVGVFLVIFVVNLFIKLLPVLIVAAIVYWIYKKIRPNKSRDYTVNNRNEKKDFDFVDVDYKDSNRR